MSGPLGAVLAQVEAGITTRAAIVARSGLDPVIVDAAVDHLVRIGRVDVPQLRTACPPSGCSGCGPKTAGGCAVPRMPAQPIERD